MGRLSSKDTTKRPGLQVDEEIKSQDGSIYCTYVDAKMKGLSTGLIVAKRNGMNMNNVSMNHCIADAP